MHTVHVLHLEHRHERYASIMKQAEEQGFQVQIHYGVLGKKNPKQEITKGHQRIVQYAKDNNLPFILVAEDDISFLGKGAFDYFIAKMPEDFSMFMGVLYVGNIEPDRRVVSSFSGGMTLYALNNSAYQWFLDMPTDVHIDRYIGSKWQELKLYVCDKYVCEQMPGYSDNRKSTVKSYKIYLEGKPLYSCEESHTPQQA